MPAANLCQTCRGADHRLILTYDISDPLGGKVNRQHYRHNFPTCAVSSRGHVRYAFTRFGFPMSYRSSVSTVPPRAALAAAKAYPCRRFLKALRMPAATLATPMDIPAGIASGRGKVF